MTYLPYHIDGADRSGRWLFTCDHAANTVPNAVDGGDLGLPRADMERHSTNLVVPLRSRA